MVSVFLGVAHLFPFFGNQQKGGSRILSVCCPAFEITYSVCQPSDQPTPLFKQGTFGANALLALTPLWILFRTIAFLSGPHSLPFKFDSDF